ncbi:MAG: prolipoprotein diacylglyceryl transferase, partial [Phycisphaeraceae bacterium]|nr:prolipoprotein diacylglyceryl transferase [Phycisphaeraceae bacterium]
LAAFAAPPGLFFGRLANFVNGELFGRECSDKLPWAVQFPQEMYRWQKPLLDELARQLPCPTLRPGDGANVYVAWFIEQVQQGNSPAIQLVRQLARPRHPSQVYEALLEGLALFLVLVIAWYKPRRPLVITGLFGIGYALVRIIGEQFREPDLGIGFQALGLTRGQWLSFGLLALGIAMLVASRFGSSKPMGGWRGTRR